MAKPDLFEQETENDQDALTLQDKNLIETYKTGSNYINNKSVKDQQSLLAASNNQNDLDTSDEEVSSHFNFRLLF